MKARKFVHQDLSAQGGHRLLQDCIDRLQRSIRQNANTIKLFGADRKVRDVLNAKRDIYNTAKRDIRAQSLWLVRESSSMPNTLVIDVTRMNNEEREFWSYHVICTRVGWCAMYTEQTPDDFDGVLKMDAESFEHYTDSFQVFLKKAKLRLDMALLPVEKNLENEPASGYVQLKL